MTEYYNPYIRLQVYCNFFNEYKIYIENDNKYELGMTISQLNKITKIPLETIRQDIITLFKWRNSTEKKISQEYGNENLDWKARIAFDEESIQYHDLTRQFENEKPGFEYLYMQAVEGEFPSKIEELFMQGRLDFIPIYMNNTFQKDYSIYLTQKEAEALYYYNLNEILDNGNDYNSNFKMQEKLDKYFQDKYKIKDGYQYTHHYNDLNGKLETINHAINNNNCLQIYYRTAKGKIKTFYFNPLKITYDATENLYCIISVYNNMVMVYRLDRILSVKPCSKDTIPQDTSLIDIAPNVWGGCFSEQPEHVKIRFYNEANVWNKVKKDLAYRTNGKLYEQDGFLYYEDTVYGISKLRTWIYGYGSSAVVIEPESLRLHIIDSLKRRLEHLP